MHIVIGGDICPTKSNINLFKNGDAAGLIGEELVYFLRNSDLCIANLECPLTDIFTPISKCGPTLSAPPTVVYGIKALGIKFLTLSNNHILDQGVQGLFSTINTLTNENIAFAGAGNNLEIASKSYIFEKEGVKVGIYCCAEHEFTIAEIDKPGANPYDPLYSFDHVSDLKSICDYVLVLYHGQKEFFRYPTPELQRVLRRFIEKGADIVVTQHGHCIGCEETYNGRKIIYGQGNFIYDDGDNEYLNSGMLISLTVDETKLETKNIFFVKNGFGIRIASDKECKELQDAYIERSQDVTNPQVLDKHFSEYAEKLIPQYLRDLGGPLENSLFARGVNIIFGRKLLSWRINIYSTKHLLRIWNFIECECHREFLLKGIMNIVRKKKVEDPSNYESDSFTKHRWNWRN